MKDVLMYLIVAVTTWNSTRNRIREDRNFIANRNDRLFQKSATILVLSLTTAKTVFDYASNNMLKAPKIKGATRELQRWVANPGASSLPLKQLATWFGHLKKNNLPIQIVTNGLVVTGAMFVINMVKQITFKEIKHMVDENRMSEFQDKLEQEAILNEIKSGDKADVETNYDKEGRIITLTPRAKAVNAAMRRLRQLRGEREE